MLFSSATSMTDVQMRHMIIHDEDHWTNFGAVFNEDILEPVQEQLGIDPS